MAEQEVGKEDKRVVKEAEGQEWGKKQGEVGGVGEITGVWGIFAGEKAGVSPSIWSAPLSAGAATTRCSSFL